MKFKTSTIIYFVLSLILGGIMIYGSLGKFGGFPSPSDVIESSQTYFTESGEDLKLQRILYISGMRQTGYFWILLGICEFLFGLLLIIPRTSLVGGVFLLPITLHILLFHVFLEYDEVGELLQTLGFFVINIVLVMRHYSKFKHLLWLRS